MISKTSGLQFSPGSSTLNVSEKFGSDFELRYVTLMPLATFVFCFAVQAAEPDLDGFKSRSMGHIITPTPVVLPSGKVSLGTLYAGYGISENLTLAVSPFLYTNYGMHNFFGRWATNISSDKSVMFDIGYYKSFTSQYIMEAVSVKAGFSRHTRRYRFNIAASGYHYIESEKPFSLRMASYNSDKYALILSTLHEFALGQRFFVNLELGALGLNYVYPYYHAGFSFAYQGDSFYTGVGASYTAAPQIPENRTQHTGSLGQTWKNSSLHPEVQIQFFF